MKLLPIRDARIKLLLLSLMHLATDGLCSYLVFAKLYPENPALSFTIFIGYNLLAFVMQSPLGILIDRHDNPNLFLSLSVAALLLGYACSELCLVTVLFIGLGNALFHVTGGKYVTNKSSYQREQSALPSVKDICRSMASSISLSACWWDAL